MGLRRGSRKAVGKWVGSGRIGCPSLAVRGFHNLHADVALWGILSAPLFLLHLAVTTPPPGPAPGSLNRAVSGKSGFASSGCRWQ